MNQPHSLLLPNSILPPKLDRSDGLYRIGSQNAVNLEEIVLHQDPVVAQLVVVEEEAVVGVSRFDRGVVGGDGVVVVVVLDVFAGRESGLVHFYRTVEETVRAFADAVEQPGFQCEVGELKDSGQEIARRAFGMDDRGFHHDLHLRTLFAEVVHDIAEQGDAGARVVQELLVLFDRHGLHGGRKNGELDVSRRLDVIKVGIQVHDDLVGGDLDAGRLDHGVSARHKIVPHEFIGIRGSIEILRQLRKLFDVRNSVSAVSCMVFRCTIAFYFT